MPAPASDQSHPLALTRSGWWLALYFLASLSYAQPQTYVMGVESQDYYPYFSFSYRNSFSEELFQRFSHAEKIHFKFQPYPIPTLYDALLNEQSIDFKFPDNPSWAAERKQAQRVYYSAGITDFIEGIYVLPENLGRDLSEFKRLGMITGFTPNALGDALEQHDIELVTDGDLSKLLLLCLRGQIDGVYAHTNLSHHWLTHNLNQPDGLIFDASLPSIEGQFHLSTTQHPELIERFNQFLLREHKQVEQLRAHYQIHRISLPTQ